MLIMTQYYHRAYANLGCVVNQHVIGDHRFETPQLSLCTNDIDIFTVAKGVYSSILEGPLAKIPF